MTPLSEHLVAATPWGAIANRLYSYYTLTCLFISLVTFINWIAFGVYMPPSFGGLPEERQRFQGRKVFLRPEKNLRKSGQEISS